MKNNKLRLNLKGKNGSWKMKNTSMTMKKTSMTMNLKQGSKIPKFGQHQNEHRNEHRNEQQKIPKFGQQGGNKGFGKMNIPNRKTGTLNIPNHFGKKNGNDKFNWRMRGNESRKI